MGPVWGWFTSLATQRSCWKSEACHNKRLRAIGFDLVGSVSSRTSSDRRQVGQGGIGFVRIVRSNEKPLRYAWRAGVLRTRNGSRNGL
jgi:hypothetical protein